MFKTSHPRHLQSSRKSLKRKLTIIIALCMMVSTVYNSCKYFSSDTADNPEPSTSSYTSFDEISMNEVYLNDFFANHSALDLMSSEVNYSYMNRLVLPHIEESVQEELTEENNSEELLFSSSQYGSEIPRTVYLHLTEPTGNLSDFSWVPEVSFEKLSKEDVPVDLGLYQSKPLEVSDTIRNYIYLTTTREARGEQFLGQLAVAEGICNRIRASDIYGSDIISILCNSYEAEKDSSGILHFYDGNGQEILNPTESCREAVDIALSGSDITSVLLEAVTALQNERYGLSLGSEYYQNGATFHFAPKYISNGAIDARRFQRVPVGFRIDNHIFYGYWHTSEDALDITIEY